MECGTLGRRRGCIRLELVHRARRRRNAPADVAGIAVAVARDRIVRCTSMRSPSRRSRMRSDRGSRWCTPRSCMVRNARATATAIAARSAAAPLRSHSASVAARSTSRSRSPARIPWRRSTRAASTSTAATPRRRLLGQHQLGNWPWTPAEIAIADEVAEGTAATIPAQHRTGAVAESERPRDPAPATCQRLTLDALGRRLEKHPQEALVDPGADDGPPAAGLDRHEAGRHDACRGTWRRTHHYVAALPHLGGRRDLTIRLEHRRDQARDATAPARPTRRTSASRDA